MDDSQTPGRTAGLEAVGEEAVLSVGHTPPGPPHPAPVAIPSPPAVEEPELSLAVAPSFVDEPPIPAPIEASGAPVFAESSEATAESEPEPSAIPTLEPEPSPIPTLEAERITPPSVSSDTPLLAAPETEVLDESAFSEDLEEAIAPQITLAEERPEAEEERREEWPPTPEEQVPELALASAAAATNIPAPVPSEAFPLISDVLPPEAAPLAPTTETQLAVPQVPPLAGDPFLAVGHSQPSVREYNLEGLPEPELLYESGPNWMLAFVSAWAGGTALYEAWLLTAPALRMAVVLSPAFLGYGTLGLGMLGFAAEAMRPVKGRLTTRVALLLPAALTLIGMALLLLSHTPGRRI